MAEITQEKFNKLLDKHGFYDENLFLPSSFLQGKVRKKIINAMTSYAQGVQIEDILAIYDDTVFGSAKEGFVISKDKFYCKASFESGRHFSLDKLNASFNGNIYLGRFAYKPTQMNKANKYALAMILDDLSSLLKQQDSTAQSSETLELSDDTSSNNKTETADEQIKNDLYEDPESDDNVDEVETIINYIAKKYSGYSEHWAVGKRISRKKAIGAISKYAQDVRVEDILFLADDTLFGNGGAGLIITHDKIYAKISLGNSLKLAIKDLKSVRISGDSVFINNIELKFISDGLYTVGYFIEALLIYYTIIEKSTTKSLDFMSECCDNPNGPLKILDTEIEKVHRVALIESKIMGRIYERENLIKILLMLNEYDIKPQFTDYFICGLPSIAKSELKGAYSLFEMMKGDGSGNATPEFMRAANSFALDVLSLTMQSYFSPFFITGYSELTSESEEEFEQKFLNPQKYKTFYNDVFIYIRLIEVLFILLLLLKDRISNEKTCSYYQRSLFGFYISIFLLPFVVNIVNRAKKPQSASTSLASLDKKAYAPTSIKEIRQEIEIAVSEFFNHYRSKPIPEDFDDPENQEEMGSNIFSASTMSVITLLGHIKEAEGSPEETFLHSVEFSSFFNKQGSHILDFGLIVHVYQDETFESSLLKLLKFIS